MLAQPHITWLSITSALGHVSGVSGAGIIMQQSENTVQSPNAVSMTGQRRRRWVNIETALVECQVCNRPGDRLVLGQRRRRLIGIEPAMSCDADPTLNRNLVGRPTSSV